MTRLRVVDDARILQLAEPPAVPLFRVLDRPRAVAPLFVVLITLALAFAFRYRTIDVDAARWMLQVARVAGSDSVLPEAESALPEPSRFVAPLSLWLSATSVMLLPAEWPWAVLVPSMAGFVATVVLLRIVVGGAFGGRTALWCAVLACGHPVLLEAAVTPSPRSLGVLFAILALGSQLDHRRSGAGPFDRRTLLTGAALGLTLLTSGPIGLVVALAFLVEAVLHTLRVSARAESTSRNDRSRVLLGTAVALVVALLFGGWWIVVNAFRDGPAALAGWLELPSREAGPAAVLPRLILATWWWLGGFVVIGVVSCVRESRSEETPSRRGHLLVLTWALVALIGAVLVASPAAIGSSGWTAAGVVPTLMLAAIGIETVAERRVRTRTALLALLGWAAVRVLLVEGLGAEPVVPPEFVWTGLIAFVLAVALARRYPTGDRDRLDRGLLIAAILATIGTFAASGLAAMNRATIDDATLRFVQTELGPFRGAAATLVVSSNPPPPSLVAVLRIVSPRAKVLTVPNRDVALGRVLDVVRPGDHAVLVELESRQSRPLDAEPRRLRITRTLPAQPFHRRRLRAYVLRLLADPPTASGGA